MSISGFFQARFNIFLFRHAPLWFSKRYLRLLGMLYYIVNRDEARQIEENVRTVFNDPREVRAIVRKTFDGIFDHYTEKLLHAYGNLNRLKREFGDMLEYSGLEYLEEARRKGGVILVTGHFGAIEYLPMAMNLKQYPVSMVLKFKTEELKRSLMERAEQNNVELIDAGNADLIWKQINALKQGSILLTECDEVEAWNTRQQNTMDAFGGRILVDRTIAFLARHTGASVLGAFLMRTERGYRLVIEPVGETAGDDRDLAQSVMKLFERFVMSAPDQWYQWKKFHKMRPETL